MEKQPEEPFFRLTPTGGGGCGKLGDHSSQSVIKINLGKQIVQPMINGTIKGKEIKCFLDTGAALSLITVEGVKELKLNKINCETAVIPRLTDVNDNPIKTQGAYEVTLTVGQTKRRVKLIACEEISIPCPILLGVDAIQKLGMELDFEKNRVRTKRGIIPMLLDSENTHPSIVRVIRAEGGSGKERIRANETIVVPARSAKLLTVRSANCTAENMLFTPYIEFRNNVDVGLLQMSKAGKARLMVVNNSETTMSIQARTVLGKAEEVDMAEIDPEWSEPNQILGMKVGRETCEKTRQQIKEEIEPFLECAPDQKEQLLDLLAKHREAVALPGEPVGSTHLMELSLKLQEGTKPFALAPYKIPHAKQAALDEEIEKLLEQGIICPTVSPWASPVVLVAKPDGSTRLCVDYRRLNAVTESDSHPLPVIEDIVMELGDSKVFSQIDLLQAYHQVPCAPDTAELTAFRVYRGHYMYLKAPFGLKQMPSLFQRLMNMIFNVKPTKKYVATYLDDVLVHSTTTEDHMKHLEDVLVKLKEAGLKLKLKKCRFFRPQVKYLGYELTSEGFKPQVEKLTAISNFPTPKSVDGVRSFLGMAGYYRIYINNFSSIARPLTDLLKKDQPFLWTHECEEALCMLKQKLTSAPLLAYPDYSREFFVETDASGVGIGAILSQKDTVSGRLKPIAFASRLLKTAERNYATVDLEALAVVWALKKFKYVIYGYDITVLTDHKPLCSLFTNTLPPGRLGRWALCIQEFGIKIQYKAGKTNKGADALSRYPVEDPTDGEEQRENKTDHYGVLSVSHSDLKIKQPPTAWTIDSLKQNQMKDPVFGSIYHYVFFDRDDKRPKVPRGLKLENFFLSGGILHYNEMGAGPREGQKIPKVVVPRALVPKLLKLYHDLPSAGHRGVEATMTRIEERYVVENLRSATKDHISACEKCVEHRGDPSVGTPLSQYKVIPKPFHQVHLDILGPLPKTERGNSYIIVYVDRFSRYTIIDSIPNRATTTVAQSLLKRVVAEYTTPAVILSDNALEFTSRVIEELCKNFDIRKVEITPYVPWANGIAEVTNSRILRALRTAVNKAQSNWDLMIPYVQLSLNTAYHHAIGDTPHYVVFGEDKILPFERMFSVRTEDPVSSGRDASEYTVERVKRKRIAFEVVQETLRQHEGRYTAKANRRRKPTKIRVGFRVYVKARTPPKKSPKLYPRWEGPYRVLTDHGRNRFWVQNLVTGKEREVHADHTKVVPETMTSLAMNPRVRLPHPGFPSEGGLVEDEEDDDAVLTCPYFPDEKAAAESRPPPIADANGGVTGAEPSGAPGDSPSDHTEQVRRDGRAQGPYGLRPRVTPPNFYGI